MDPNNQKRQAWALFISKQPPGPIDPLKFRDFAKPESNAFHDDFEWDVKEIVKDYYEKRAANLIVKYGTIFNSTTVNQVITHGGRLHLFNPAKLSDMGIKKKYAATADEIAKNEENLQQIRAAIWSRLRRVVRDMYDFRKYLPEFKEIYEYLLPLAQDSTVSTEPMDFRKGGTGAQ